MKAKVLKPCPFCGGEPEIKQTGRAKLKIKCKSCVIGYEQRTIKFGIEWLEERMIETWNKRTAIDQALEQYKKELVEKLEAEYKKVHKDGVTLEGQEGTGEWHKSFGIRKAINLITKPE